MGAFAFLALIPGLISGFLMAKRIAQDHKDRNRRTYRVMFPADLDEIQITAWLRSISGRMRGRRFNPGGVPTMVFEMWATDQGIEHYVKVPWQYAEFVIAQLHGSIPGIRVQYVEPKRRVWVRAVELGLSNSHRTLRIYSAADLANSLLHSVDAVTENETVLLQFVVTPTSPRPLPEYHAPSQEHSLRMLLHGTEATRDEIRDRRTKQEEPNYLAVLRVAATAETDTRAQHLLSNVRGALTAAQGPHTRLMRRLVSKNALQGRLDASSGPLMFGMQLSAPELAAVIGWPIDNPFHPGLAKPLGKVFPANGSVPQTGIVLGQSAFHGRERPVALGFSEALMHSVVVGSTGVGKSALLAHFGRQIMDAGHGLILMETEGNLYHSVLDYIPRSRLADVILLDFADQYAPVGLNVLDQGHQATVIDEIIELFAHRYGTGIWSDEYILNGMRTLGEAQGMTLLDLGPLLAPTADEVEWVDSVVRQVKDPELLRWWQRHDNRSKSEQQKRADPVLSRLAQMSSRPELRHVFGQSKSSFQMRDVLSQNKILLINLKGVSRDTASLAGTLLMNAIWHAAKVTGQDKTRPTYVLLDEFADFMDLPIDTESMLAQARKHQLGLVLAHQHMSQLHKSMQDAVLANARNKVVFQTSAADAQVLARELSPAVSRDDITTLQKFEAIASLLVPGGSSGPVSITTNAPGKPTGVSNAARAASRTAYGRSIQDVQADIKARRQGPEDRPKRRRRATSGGWG